MPTKKQHIVHISGVQQFKACREAWNWSSPQRGNLTPVDKYAPFFTGSMVHHCLEHWYKFGTPTDQAISDFCSANLTRAEFETPTIQEQVYLVLGMMKHYHLWQKYNQSWLADREFAFIANEQDFSVPLWGNSRHQVKLKGTFDGVVKSLHNGKLYLWEIKTTRSIIERLKQTDLDAQTDAYLNGAERVLGVEIAGIVYTILRKKVPEVKVLKSGDLSQAIDKDMTPEWYLNTIKEHHKELGANKDYIKAQYGDTLNALLSQENRYFARVVVNRSKAALADSWRQLQIVAQAMIDPRTPIYRSESNACNYCLFRTPCIAKRDGEDYKAILAKGYEAKKRYLDEIE